MAHSTDRYALIVMRVADMFSSGSLFGTVTDLRRYAFLVTKINGKKGLQLESLCLYVFIFQYSKLKSFAHTLLSAAQGLQRYLC